MADNKTKATQKSVLAFIDGVEPDTKRADALKLVDLMQEATGEPPRLWGPSIVGFGSHHYVYESGREGDIPLVAFSPRKPAIVLYGLTGFDGADSLLKKLGKHNRGKGCVYVKKLDDLDLKTLQRLLTKSIAATQATSGCVACDKG
jgi:hypothetical protein